jgi:hypothetical protein
MAGTDGGKGVNTIASEAGIDPIQQHGYTFYRFHMSILLAGDEIAILGHERVTGCDGGDGDGNDDNSHDTISQLFMS